MNDCIFCKIIKGESPSYKVWENEDFLAILDIFPNTRGVTLVLPKEHMDSYAFDLDTSYLHKFIDAIHTVAKKMETGLNVTRVAMVWEGMGINHLHAKLYPLNGLDDKYAQMEHGTEKVFFDTYPGYITTKIGEMANEETLKKIQEEIRQA